MSSLGGFGVTWRKFAKGFFANEEIVTTEYSDWATDCPEYKVTAVQVRPSNHWSSWQLANNKHRTLAMRVQSPVNATDATES